MDALPFIGFYTLVAVLFFLSGWWFGRMGRMDGQVEAYNLLLLEMGQWRNEALQSRLQLASVQTLF
jgi:hypothetical protein